MVRHQLSLESTQPRLVLNLYSTLTIQLLNYQVPFTYCTFVLIPLWRCLKQILPCTPNLIYCVQLFCYHNFLVTNPCNYLSSSWLAQYCRHWRIMAASMHMFSLPDQVILLIRQTQNMTPNLLLGGHIVSTNCIGKLSFYSWIDKIC